MLYAWLFPRLYEFRQKPVDSAYGQTREHVCVLTDAADELSCLLSKRYAYLFTRLYHYLLNVPGVTALNYVLSPEIDDITAS